MAYPLPTPVSGHRCAARAFVCACLALLACSLGERAHAQTDVLSECVALSPADDDVHACLDNYLDVMDERIERASDDVRRASSGDTLAAFERAQVAFDSFRRDNCLWYLAFNTPRSQAEKLAKNCLVRHSLQRLVELQGLLIANDGAAITFDGHYVFDGTRNSFQPCGSDRRFWVGGDDVAIASLQQQYLERTSDEGQRLFARLDGALQAATDARAGHAGRLRLDAVRELREAAGNDCRLPGGAPPLEAAGTDADLSADASAGIDAGIYPVTDAGVAAGAGVTSADATASVAVSDNPVADPDAAIGAASSGDADRVPQGERLTAYFGAWLAECEMRASGSSCRIVVDFDAGQGDGVEGLSTLVLVKDDEAGTRVQLALPADAVTVADQVRWSVDDELLGAIDTASLRQAETGVELAVNDERFIDEQLLPLLRGGYTLRVRTLGDDVQRSATLVGLTRALNFADDFLAGGG